MIFGWLAAVSAQIQTNAGVQYLMNAQKDMSTDFYDLSNTYFLADSLSSFDVSKGIGKVNWKRYRLSPRQAFNTNGYWPVRMQMLDFPDAAYENVLNGIKHQRQVLDVIVAALFNLVECLLGIFG